MDIKRRYTIFAENGNFEMWDKSEYDAEKRFKAEYPNVKLVVTQADSYPKSMTYKQVYDLRMLFVTPEQQKYALRVMMDNGIIEDD